MASGDTKTEHLLDVLANGSRADIPADNCCNTKTQNYILGAVNRMVSLEEEVEELQNNPDVTDIVSTYQDLTNYDKTTLTDGDVIRVLTDSTHDDESAYYRYNAATDSFDYIGTTRAYTDFVGTSGGMAGAAGLVPAPQATDVDKYLKSDGTWATVSGGGGGRGIVSIEKTGTQGLVDTYTITYTDGTTSTFEVTNGQSGGGEENLEKNNLLYENLRQLAKLSTFPLYSVKGNIGIIGDSTISGYRGVKIARLLQVDTGYAITDISYPGDTFTGQLNKWNALNSTTKSNLNYVFMQLGLNDVFDITTSHFRELCATLINKIRQDSPDAVLILCSCVPCKQRFYDLNPNNPARALAAQQVWEDYYNDVKNNYYNADKICYLHSDAMAFDGYNLRKELDSGDHIHENEWGDKIIAFSWCAEAFDNSVVKASKTISSIAVTTPPTKTSYTTDDYFDPTGMVVTATYSDSTTAVISGYTYSPTTKLTTSVTAITISYAGKTTTTPITVTESTKVLESIEATYTQGQTVVYPTTSLDSLKTNLVVVATYDDTSTQTLQANDYTLSGTLAVGTSTVTVTYENKTDTFSVVVSEMPTLVSLTHTGTLQKTDYVAGESFDPTGLTFVATYSDTSTQTVTPTFAPATLSTGDTQVTASYTFNGVTETDVITGITVEAGQWVIGTLNDITHDAYKQKTFDDGLAYPYWLYYTDSNYFENRTITKVCAKGLVAGIEITLYASPITSSPTTTGEIEVGHFTLTQDSTPKDYDVIDPQKIPTGYTLAIHFTGSNNQRIMEVPKANALSRLLAAKYTRNQSAYTVSLNSSGPEYFVPRSEADGKEI